MAHWLDGVAGLRTSEETATLIHYRRVFFELGGTEPIRSLPETSDDQATFSACVKYPLSVWSWLLTGTDEEFNLRIWPRLASVAFNHAGIQQFNSYDPSLTELIKILSRMASNAKALAEDFTALQNAALVWRPPSEKSKEAVVSEICARITAPLHLSIRSSTPQFFFGPMMLNLAESCDVEVSKLDAIEPDELKVGGERNFGLHSLVQNFGTLWLAVKSNNPSAEKLKLSGGDPPFVRAIIEICRMTATAPPTRSMVATALRKVVPVGGWAV